MILLHFREALPIRALRAFPDPQSRKETAAMGDEPSEGKEVKLDDGRITRMIAKVAHGGMKSVHARPRENRAKLHPERIRVLADNDIS